MSLSLHVCVSLCENETTRMLLLSPSLLLLENVVDV
jgi:hypothetical protein